MAQRKGTGDADSSGAMLRRADVAAALLVRQMEACERSMQACLDLWDRTKEDAESDEAEFFLDKAVMLIGATARLGEALARMKGESSQRIRVERVAESARPPSRVNKNAGLSPRDTLQTRKRAPRSAQDEGEGGDT